MQETNTAPTTELSPCEFDDKSLQLLKAFRAGQAGQCVASVTHDVNNCLGAIMAYAELVALDENLPGESRRMMGEVVKAVRKGSTLMGALTSIASDSGKGRSVVFASALLAHVTMLRRHSLKTANIHVEVEERGVQNSLEVDEPAVSLALLYLLANEIEDAQQAGRTRIDILIDEREDCVVFEVAHGGPSLAVDRCDVMFEPFYTSKGAGRFGLGLYEARTTAERHGGDLEYDAERGFVLTLPREMRPPSEESR